MAFEMGMGMEMGMGVGFSAAFSLDAVVCWS